MLSNKKI